MAQTTPRPQLTDPLIDEIRRIRDEISRECNNDLNQLFEELRRIQEQHREKVLRRDDRSAKDR